MPKLDLNRNYYADLEIPPTASVDEIKKQFRKLALKYHPDRNPGREAEVNSKFQIIQSAQEILTDPAAKRKYDDQLNSRTSRYGGASGVRGNPWQNAGSEFQPPPRRTGPSAASQRPSGAQRYSGFTSSGAGSARPPRPPSRDDPEVKRANAKAWEDMRSSRPRTNQPPPTPARPAPGRAPSSSARDARTSDSEGFTRTASQRQKAQASFGSSARGRGFVPGSPGVVEDEPQVASNNYHTTRRNSIFTQSASSARQTRQSESASAAHESRHSGSTSAAQPHRQSASGAPLRDPLAQFREERQSTPYHTPGGEKTRLREEGLGRNSSTREGSRRSDGEGLGTGTFPFPDQRPRSSSTPKHSATPGSSSNDGGSEDSTRANTGYDNAGHADSRRSTYNARTSDRYKPNTTAGDPQTASDNRPAAANGPNFASTTSHTAPANGAPSPSVYASPFASAPYPRHRLHPNFLFTQDKFRSASSNVESLKESLSEVKPYRSTSSSGASHLFPFENLLKEHMEGLINKKRYVSAARKDANSLREASERASRCSTPRESETGANESTTSFNFSAQAPYAETTQPRNSTENINTRFVPDDHRDWQFKAGGSPTTDEPPTPRSSSSGLGRASPIRPTARARRPTSRVPSGFENSGDVGGSDEATKPHFSAGEWSEKIGPHHFVPQPPQSNSTSPNRRTNSKKNSKPVKMTMGSAGMVDEESSSVEAGQDNAQPPSGTDSPVAMDIDSPQPEKADETPKATQNGARNIHVEPTRPEWRAGSGNVDPNAPPVPPRPVLDVDTGTWQASTPAAASIPRPVHNGGSEDSEEFMSNLADLKNVEPLNDSNPSGLKSFNDLASALPFDSKPAEKLPLEKEVVAGPLQFPVPPVAPRLPVAMGVSTIRPNVTAFRKYAGDFYMYMDKWETFQQQVLDHFSARQAEYKKRRQQFDLAWLDSSAAGGGGDAARTYLLELEQDHDVRQQWARACDEHQVRVCEYVAFKDRMK